MRLLRSLAFLSILSSSAFALQFSAGLDLGFQKAWLDRWAIETPLVGLNIPVFITDEHGVQLSVRYSPKGYENDSAYGYQSDWLQYIDIPVKYLYFPEFFPIKLGLSAGFNFSYLMGVSAKEADGFEESFMDTAYTNVSTIDYGLLVGVHYQKPLAYGSLMFSMEYYAGFPVIRRSWVNTITGEPETREVKNHAFAVTLGYELPRFGSGAAPAKKSEAASE